MSFMKPDRRWSTEFWTAENASRVWNPRYAYQFVEEFWVFRIGVGWPIVPICLRRSISK